MARYKDHDYDLLIDPGAGGEYRARVLQSPGGQSAGETSFRHPFTRAEVVGLVRPRPMPQAGRTPMGVPLRSGRCITRVGPRTCHKPERVLCRQRSRRDLCANRICSWQQWQPLLLCS
jgi:hypothetical protein